MTEIKYLLKLSEKKESFRGERKNLEVKYDNFMTKKKKKSLESDIYLKIKTQLLIALSTHYPYNTLPRKSMSLLFP